MLQSPHSEIICPLNKQTKKQTNRQNNANPKCLIVSENPRPGRSVFRRKEVTTSEGLRLWVGVMKCQATSVLAEDPGSLGGTPGGHCLLGKGKRTHQALYTYSRCAAV